MEQEWKENICIADNVISSEIIDNWTSYLFSQCQWGVNFQNGTVFLNNEFFENREKNKIYEQFQFVSLQRIENKDFNPITHLLYLPLVNWCMYNNFTIDYNDILKCKLNVTTRAKKESKDKYSLPHIDLVNHQPNQFTAIYYLNDCDGDTFLFKQSAQELSNKNLDSFSNLTIKSRISPKKGRLIIFPIDQVHAGSHPIESGYRAVINYNFKMQYMPTKNEKINNWEKTGLEIQRFNFKDLQY